MAPVTVRPLLHALRAMGGFERVAASRWRQERLLVLCYHGVSILDEHEWDPELYVTPAFLRRRFELLRDGGYAVLPLDEAVRRLAAGTLPPRAVTITFDDGTYDFYERALPVLREFGYPATVYASTYYSRVQRPVFDPVLRYIAWRGRARGSCSPEGLATGDAPLQVGDAKTRDTSAARIRAAALANGLNAAGKDEVARTFAERLGVSYDTIVGARLLRIMTAAQLAELPAAGIDIQLHTHRHRTPDDRALFLRELDDNRVAIETSLGGRRELRHFCYPSGKHDALSVNVLRELGIASATTCEPGLASRNRDPLRMPRFVDTMLQREIVFESWASGVAERLRGLVRRGAPAQPGVLPDGTSAMRRPGVAASAALRLTTPSVSSGAGNP